jgi:hypothetical protein
MKADTLACLESMFIEQYKDRLPTLMVQILKMEALREADKQDTPEFRELDHACAASLQEHIAQLEAEQGEKLTVPYQQFKNLIKLHPKALHNKLKVFRSNVQPLSAYFGNDVALELDEENTTDGADITTQGN